MEKVMMFEVRGMRYEVRGTNFEVRGLGYEARVMGKHVRSCGFGGLWILYTRLRRVGFLRKQ